MQLRKALWVVATAGMLAMGSAATSMSLLGCSSGVAGKTAKIQSGDMPEGADWTGVYYSELYGHLHVVQDGTAVSGKWIRPVKDRWGEIHGTVTGDVARFSWTEHTIGAVGPNSTKAGKGYFKYKRPPGDNVDDTIVGEIGVGGDEVGQPWDAIKQRNQLPDLASIGGTGSTDIGGGDWDSQGKEKGEPEAPAPPPPP
jgi:hypothetical protein